MLLAISVPPLQRLMALFCDQTRSVPPHLTIPATRQDILTKAYDGYRCSHAFVQNNGHPNDEGHYVVHRAFKLDTGHKGIEVICFDAHGNSVEKSQSKNSPALEITSPEDWEKQQVNAGRKTIPETNDWIGCIFHHSQEERDIWEKLEVIFAQNKESLKP